MTETKKLMTLLRSLEAEVTEQADALMRSRCHTDLSESIAVILGTREPSPVQSAELKLLVSLKMRAQEEIAGEQELIIVELAAGLASAVAKLARQTSQIEHANLLSRQRQEFVAMLTHDLKNPLIGANRILDLIVDGHFGAIGAEQRGLLEQLKIGNNESLQLIGVLGDVYRYESNPGDVHLKKCDLLSIVEQAFNALKVWSVKRDVCVTLTVPDSLAMVYLDPLAIQRLLDNLFGNALKFTAQNGSIDVRLVAMPKEIVLEVQDNGSGIPVDERAQLFKRFSQGLAGKQFNTGSGLGLYLCKQIAEAHGGRIECLDCESGALFRVTLSTQLTPDH